MNVYATADKLNNYLHTFQSKSLLCKSNPFIAFALYLKTLPVNCVRLCINKKNSHSKINKKIKKYLM